MKIKLISCEVLRKEIDFLKQKHEMDFDVVYTQKSSHTHPDTLNQEIQCLINDSIGYDYILLGFGLCGNSARGLTATHAPLIIPRAHDCCTIFLGSRERFNLLFSENKSMPWGSCGYSGIGEDYLRTDDMGLGIAKDMEELIEMYGEENAQYIYDTLHPKTENEDVLFIRINEVHDDEIFNGFLEKMKKDGKKVIIEDGSLSLLEKMLLGHWDDEFLKVEKNCVIDARYDENEIIYCKKL
ncbi:MAG: DUF1638 domain-containing protein [Clostridia bacterium]|nr:DUF1638 domain-containing protein [Clostridia bacterium]